MLSEKIQGSVRPAAARRSPGDLEPNRRAAESRPYCLGSPTPGPPQPPSPLRPPRSQTITQRAMRGGGAPYQALQRTSSAPGPGTGAAGPWGSGFPSDLQRLPGSQGKPPHNMYAREFHFAICAFFHRFWVSQNRNPERCHILTYLHIYTSTFLQIYV